MFSWAKYWVSVRNRLWTGFTNRSMWELNLVFRLKTMVMLMTQCTDGVWFSITVMVTINVRKLFRLKFRQTFSVGYMWGYV